MAKLNKINKIGDFNLASAIHRCHGGFSAFKELLNKQNGIKPESES